MPRTTGTTQRVRPAAASTRAANFTAAATTARPGAAATPRPTPAPTHDDCCCCKACVELQCLDRTRFFAGQLLTQNDLNNEQSYWLAKNRLHNRFLHGWGVVCGLQVSCTDCDGWVLVNPGYAIDPCGNDVIVCASQSFNVLAAIQACCTPTRPADCSPLRYRPPTTCQDAIQTWCITIEYQEQPSRLVTPLQKSTSTSACECGCGGACGCRTNGNGNGNGNGCGCGCGHSKSSGSCSCATATATSSTAACEPTRIIEGFQLGVCQPEPAPTKGKTAPPQPGTFAWQFDQCFLPLQSLIAQKPTLVDANGNALSDAQAYQAVCQYLGSAKKALASAYITHCALESALDGIRVPAPGGNNYISTLADIVNTIAQTAAAAVLDCLCASVLPPCPADPCDKRLILACVTVQNGKILNICHFGGGRRQVVTFPSLFYWLSIFGFDKTLANLGSVLELLCCGEPEQRQRIFNADISQRESLATGGGNPAAFTSALFASIAQTLGATVVNAFSAQANAVDLRPLVGLGADQALRTLESYRITGSSITQKDVSADPSWMEPAIAAAPAYAPSAFKVGDPLTLYTRGKIVVGLEATNPTEALGAQVAQLQQTVNNLAAQIGGHQNPTASNRKK